jgi:hypothetical protein
MREAVHIVVVDCRPLGRLEGMSHVALLSEGEYVASDHWTYSANETVAADRANGENA